MTKCLVIGSYLINALDTLNHTYLAGKVETKKKKVEEELSGQIKAT